MHFLPSKPIGCPCLLTFHWNWWDFLWYLALDVTASCICEIHCLALDGFDLNTVHQLSSKEKKITAEPGFEPRAAGWEAIVLPLPNAAPRNWNDRNEPFPFTLQIKWCYFWQTFNRTDSHRIFFFIVSLLSLFLSFSHRSKQASVALSDRKNKWKIGLMDYLELMWSKMNGIIWEFLWSSS